MKTLVVSLFIIGIAIAAAFFVHKDPGQVDVVFQGLHYGPMSLGIVLAGVGVAFLVFYILLRVFFNLINAPRSIRNHNERKYLEKSHEAMGRGLVEYSEGQYDKAESTLTRYTPPTNNCEVASLITAAKVANDRGQFEASDNYLKKAAECAPDAELATKITEAELLLQRNANKDATKLLSSIHSNNPKNRRVIYLLVKAYEANRNWESMSDLLKVARKKRVNSNSELLSLERVAAANSLLEAPADNAQSIYSNLPSHVQELSDVISAYAQKLKEIGKDGEAESIVTKALNTNWDEKLAELYGNISAPDVTAQIQQATTWKKSNGESAALLLTLGNLSYKNQQWAEAKDYVVSSIEIKPSTSGFFLLGKILEAIDDPVAALEAYKHGYVIDNSISAIASNNDKELKQTGNNKKLTESA